MQQAKPQIIALSNNSLLKNSVKKNSDYLQNLIQLLKQKQSLIDKPLQNARKA